MAEEVAVGLLAPVIEQLAKLVGRPIARQFNYLCCFTSNINSLKDEAKKLDDATEGLEREVQTARDNVQEPVPEVKTWLTDSNNLKVEINGILDEAKNVGSVCSKLGARFSLSKRAKKTTDRTKELRGEKNFEVKFQQGPPAARQAAVQLGKTYEFESRKKIEEDIMATLRGGDVNMIGICGMGGLGKTVMAQKIRNRVLNENVFEEVVMTVVSQQANMSNIQVEIGDSLGLHLKDDSSESRVQKLHARLSGTKRILVILDDVWEAFELENLGIPCDSKVCTILITSRNIDALSAMGYKVENKLFGMEILSEEEAWFLFREGAGTCVDDPNLNSIAKKVAQECRGLPIALKALGLALQNKKAAIWKDALRELKHCDADIPNYIKEVYTPLILSYNFLDPEMAKSLFLLCCLFPEDSHIPLEQLTYFCMGLGIFKGITNMGDARNKMWALAEVLKDRSLLLDSDYEGFVRMHDVVRDVCTFIAKERGYIGKDGCTWISSSHLVGERNELLSRSRSCPNLRLLFLDDDDDDDLLGFKFDDAFMEGMRELHVLCIQNYSLTTLPHPTQSLGKLNTLILDSCYQLETISLVGELVHLEILICRNCDSIEKLPSEMKGLNRLKLLELTGCGNLQSIGRGIISSLVGLEELKMRGSFDKWEGEDREERENAGARLRELEALTKLACLEIDIKDPSLVSENMPLLSKKIVRFIIRTDRYSYFPSESSKAMSLCLERETRLGDWIEMQFLRETECLELKGNGANNVDLVKIQNIRWLRLRDCESMKNVDATVFPSIEHLRIHSLPKLQEIYDGPISPTSFQNLKELNLRDLRALTQFWKSSSVCENNYVPHFTNLSSIHIAACHSLRNLGQLSMAGKDCLPQLQQLRIEGCEIMEQVFLWNEEESGENKTSIESQQKRHVFPKLKEVELRLLPNLITFYQGIQGIKFPLLREMKIQICPNMKSIIGSCSADIDEISFGNSLEVLEIMNHNPFCGHEIPSSLFNGLKELTIKKYVGSMCLLPLSMAANLVSLKKLCISNCDEMIKVIEDEVASGGERILVFPKLEFLYLIELHKLVSFCDLKCEVELPLLREVDIRRCPNMRNLSSGLVATPNLDVFTTDVAIDRLKELVIFGNDENAFNHHKIYVSLFNRLEKLTFSKSKGSMSLFSSSAVENLVNLKVLEIKSCDGILVKVIEDREEKEDGKVVSGGQIRTVVFPKLEELYLNELPKLVSFCEWKCDVELPSLTKVTIRRCRNMENFSLGLVVTPNLEAFTTDLTTYVGVGVGVNVAFNSLKELVIGENENPLYDHKISVSLFNGLEKLTFTSYKGSMSLFSSSAVGNLVNLKVLRIDCCYNLVNVIENEDEKEDGKVVSGSVVFPKLEELRLYWLPKLVSFCEWKCELPSLTKVTIRGCRNMENFSLGLVVAPNLKIVETDDAEIGATKELYGLLHQHYIAGREKEINEEEKSSEEKDEIEEEEDDQN